MKRNSTLGALHPILFFVFVYAFSIFMALFVCRSIYYTINGNDVTSKPVHNIESTAVALR